MRYCGSCTICCYIGSVPVLNKAAHAYCEYQQEGCSIYGRKNRPHICKKFQCLWLRGLGKKDDIPNKSNLLITTNVFNGGIWIVIVEYKKDALLNEGKNFALDVVSKIELPAIVSNYGSLPPNDKGDRVIIKESLLNRTNSLRSNLLNYLDEKIGIYKLVIK